MALPNNNELGQGNNVLNIPKKTLGADTSPIFLNEGMRVAAGLMNFVNFCRSRAVHGRSFNLDKLHVMSGGRSS